MKTRMRSITFLKSISGLTWIFAKEQIKEPVALFWILISPCALFYFYSFSREMPPYEGLSYLQASSWFYSYMACTVAFFGFAMYIVGRREGGFTRSFIHTARARAIYLSGHYTCYSIIAMAYGVIFYLLTKMAFGSYDLREMLGILGRFYLCFMLFCIPASLLAIAPLTFNNAHTLSSISAFIFLAVSLAATRHPHGIVNGLDTLNPLTVARQIMQFGLSTTDGMIVGIGFVGGGLTLIKRLIINPVWSRY